MNVLITRGGEYVNTIVVDTLAEAQAAYPGCDCVDVTSAPVIAPVRTVTKLAFRRRFTLQERIALDTAVSGLNPLIPADAVAAMRTMQKDLELAEEINLEDPDVIHGLAFLQSLGLLTAERVQEILL